MYVFSVWSPSVKDKMGYTDKQINFVGTAANWGVYLGFIPGLVYDFLGSRITCAFVCCCTLIEPPACNACWALQWQWQWQWQIRTVAAICQVSKMWRSK
jgi:hypothetical protein